MKSLSRKMVAIAAMVAVSGLITASVVRAADKLTIKNTNGTPIFNVDDAGTINNGKIIITSTGYLGLGTLAPNAAIHSKGNTSNQTQVLMTRQDTNNNGGAGFVAYHNNITNASCTAAATPSACCTGLGTGTCPSTILPADNDRLGYFLFGSYKADGTTPMNAAGISAHTETAWTDTVAPAYFAFETTGLVGSRTERLRISGEGNVVTGNNGGAATADLATNVTNGFLYIPSVAGTLSTCGSVKQYAGHVPVWFDTTSNKICTCQGATLKCATLN